jgi:hypothetical protein
MAQRQSWPPATYLLWRASPLAILSGTQYEVRARPHESRR